MARLKVVARSFWQLVAVLLLFACLIVAATWRNWWLFVPNAQMFVDGKVTRAEVFRSHDGMYLVCSDRLPGCEGCGHAYWLQPRSGVVLEVFVETTSSVSAETKTSSLAHIVQGTDFFLLPGAAYCRSWPPSNREEIAEAYEVPSGHFDPNLRISLRGFQFTTEYDDVAGQIDGAFSTPRISVRW
jgi:hypothetical protein